MLAQIPDLIGSPVVLVACGAGDSVPRIRYLNEAAAALLGRAASECLDQPLSVLADEAGETVEFAHLVDAVQRRREIGLSLRLTGRADGGWAEVKGRPLPGEGFWYLVEWRDVTETRALVDAVRCHECRHNALAEAISDSVYYLRVEPDCRLVLDWSAGAFAQLVGYSPAEIEALVDRI